MVKLTPKQKQALELASLGLSISEIAALMNVSVRTVEHHLSESRERLSAKNTTGAVASALRLNIIKCILVIMCVNALSLNYSMDMRRPTRTRINNSVRVARNVQIKTGREMT